jgi:hypothetical protein
MAIKTHTFDKFLNNSALLQNKVNSYEQQLFEKYCNSVRAQEDRRELAAEMAQVFSSASRFSFFESDDGQSFFIYESFEGDKFGVIGGRTADMGKILDELEGGL